MNPEDIIKQRYEEQKNTIQNTFASEWRVLSSQGASPQELQKLYNSHRQKALSLNTNIEKQLSSLKEIDSLAQQGAITNPDEVKTRMILGPEAEKAVFPGQQNIAKQYGELGVYRNRLEDRLAQFEEDPGGQKIKQKSKWWFQEQSTKPLLKVYVGTEGSGKDKRDIFRMANQEEQMEHMYTKMELERVKELQNIALKDVNVSTRLRKAASDSRRFGAGIIGSMVEEKEKRRPTPEPVKQNNDPLGLGL